MKENKTTAQLTNVCCKCCFCLSSVCSALLWIKRDAGGTAAWQVVERKKASCCYTLEKVQCLWCVLCTLSLERHSAGIRCYLGLTGWSGHRSSEGMKTGESCGSFVVNCCCNCGLKQKASFSELKPAVIHFQRNSRWRASDASAAGGCTMAAIWATTGNDLRLSRAQLYTNA